jgi:RNA polymerase sigma factor (sigma-70 family)
MIMSKNERQVLASLSEKFGGLDAPRSFEEIFALHHRAVFRAARSLVFDAGLAEDVTQEVFLKVYKHEGELPNAERLRPWLLKIATHVALNTLRARTRVADAEAEFAQDEKAGRLVPSADEEYERMSEVEVARHALAHVSEPMRSALLLKQKGLSYREIAVRLSVKEGTVGSLIARGRKEFARMYGTLGHSRQRPYYGSGPSADVRGSETQARSAVFEIQEDKAEIALGRYLIEIDELHERLRQDQLDIERLQAQTREALTTLQATQ